MVRKHASELMSEYGLVRASGFPRCVRFSLPLQFSPAIRQFRRRAPLFVSISLVFCDGVPSFKRNSVELGTKLGLIEISAPRYNLVAVPSWSTCLMSTFQFPSQFTLIASLVCRGVSVSETVRVADGVRNMRQVVEKLPLESLVRLSFVELLTGQITQRFSSMPRLSALSM